MKSETIKKEAYQKWLTIALKKAIEITKHCGIEVASDHMWAKFERMNDSGIIVDELEDIKAYETVGTIVGRLFTSGVTEPFAIRQLEETLKKVKNAEIIKL